jgi:hypothetical protein
MRSDNYEQFTFTSGVSYTIGEVPVEEVGSGLSWSSCLFQSIPDVEVDDAREGSWSHCLVGPLLLRR